MCRNISFWEKYSPLRLCNMQNKDPHLFTSRSGAPLSKILLYLLRHLLIRYTEIRCPFQNHLFNPKVTQKVNLISKVALIHKIIQMSIKQPEFTTLTPLFLLSNYHIPASPSQLQNPPASCFISPPAKYPLPFLIVPYKRGRNWTQVDRKTGKTFNEKT